MLFLLALPVIGVVAAVHCGLMLYAPSNVVVRRVQASPPRWRVALGLLALAASLLLTSHVVACAIASGAPPWLNLVVLVFAWDAIKFVLLAASVAGRRAGARLLVASRRGRGARSRRWSPARM